MKRERYALAEVLTIAQLHPFYHPEIEYPPCEDTIEQAHRKASGDRADYALSSQPLLQKSAIYKAAERLTNDVDRRNTYRQSSYLSITGGGSGGTPMMFAVDVHENRQQRIQMGKFIRLCGVVSPRDWVLSTHVSGGFYRSLDLMTEILENAGASVLSGGDSMTLDEIIQTLLHYHVNVLAGDGSQIVRVTYHVATMSPEVRSRLKLDKIIYTSEPLTATQQAFIRTTLGDAIGNAELTGEHGLVDEDSNSVSDFVFDTRNMLLEIFPTAVLDAQGHFSFDPDSEVPSPLPMGQTGLVVQTSLQRLRNPLVRYITGDVGSVHSLPTSVGDFIPEGERKHLRVLRMQGRDRRFSFKWSADYTEFERLKALMQTPKWDILHWQIILDRLNSSPEVTLEIRLLRIPTHDGQLLSDECLVKKLWEFFFIIPENQHLFQVTFLKELSGFERSSTAGKIINFVDRVH
ncbi:uncharacterized protein KD926_004709 [Aspergillus affinis]|uniref:uncharacterized protein n=1 Tax=Aspergillus affinis TaxID=1070780 RepID=UPI0022FE05DB|nr:uncharacterized protein KD926_004709 [Aspergillus affinis]KAI9042919.1 hypothetical protein KD926_004709 [Aspergillus affinis]